MDLNNLIARQNLLKASTLAGLAFSNTRNAAAHSISYPFTAYFNVPHGIAASFALLPLLEINGPLIQNEIKKIQMRLNLKNTEELKEKIAEIHDSVLKYKLREWNVKYEQLDWLAAKSFKKGRMENNIVDLTKEDIRRILGEIY